MGDSQSKQFGDQYLGQLQGQLDKKAPVFDKSLFAGAGDTTGSAWSWGQGLGDYYLSHGGMNDMQGSSIFDLGQVGKGYSDLAPRGAALLNPVLGGYGDLSSGYKAAGANGGLTAGMSDAMGKTAGLGSAYGGLSTAYDPNSAAYKTLRQGVADDTLSNLGSQFTSSGRFGGGSYVDTASKGLGDALAGLDYNNMQNDINNRYRSLDSQKGIYDTLFGQGQTGQQNVFASLAGQGGALAGQGNTANSILANDAASLAGRAGVAQTQFNQAQQLQNNQQDWLGALGQIGSAQDANAQGKLLGNADLFDRTKNAELDRLLKIGAGFGGAATDAANEAPWWQQGLGALLGFGGSALSGGVFGGA